MAVGNFFKGLAKYNPLTGVQYAIGSSLSKKAKSNNQKAMDDAAAASARDFAQVRALTAQRPGFKSSLDSPEFNQYKAFAAGGANPLFDAQRSKVQDAGRRAIEDQDASLGGATANAYSGLAMGGGLSSGARERVGMGGLTENIFAKQKLRQGTSDQLADTGLAEAQARLDAQKGVADAVTRENQSQNEFNMNAYKENLGAETGLIKSQQERELAAKNRKKFLGIF